MPSAKLLLALLVSSLSLAVSIPPSQQHRFAAFPAECTNFQGMDSCLGNEIKYPESTENRRWQTAPAGRGRTPPSADWQHYHNLQGYARVSYNLNRDEATVEVITVIRVKPSGPILYRFGGDDAQWQESPKKTLRAHETLPQGLTVVIWVPSVGNSSLSLDPLYFIWQNPVVAAPHTEEGQKGAIVELFGWPYKDVAKECETFLGKAGYMGVKIFPGQEHLMSYHYLERGELNPWFYTYQPVSYRMHSRLGSREELREMIHTCRKHGVRVYADAVINHMTGGGNDINMHRNQAGGHCQYWGPKNSSAGSPFFTHSWAYENNEFTGQRPTLEFPAVPYGPTDFHCERSLGDWSSGFSLNYGWLVGLSDLNTEKPYVQQRIADYLTDLMGLGFSGFRIDAAKHIQPKDLAEIFARFRENIGGIFPDDFISWLEVIIGGERMLLACEDNPYNYYENFDNLMRKAGISNQDISKIKIWSSDYPKEHPICGRWVLPASRFAIQNDDHDQQNPGSSSRDMADKGSVLLKDRDVDKHRSFEKLLFGRNDADWKIRLILSGYTFMKSGAQGYPDGKSDCALYTKTPYAQPHERCLTVPYAKAHDSGACGYTVYAGDTKEWAEGQYTRVHRDREIILAMRKWMGLQYQAISNENIGLPESCM